MCLISSVGAKSLYHSIVCAGDHILSAIFNRSITVSDNNKVEFKGRFDFSLLFYRCEEAAGFLYNSCEIAILGEQGHKCPGKMQLCVFNISVCERGFFCTETSLHRHIYTLY